MSHRLAVLAVLALILAGAPGASAADFNVSNSAGLTSALTTAASNGTADRILLAAGTYTGPFTYNASENLEVLGAGAGQSVIAVGANNGYALLLQDTSATYHVADVGFAIGFDNAKGLQVQGPALVERVSATAAPAVTNAIPIMVTASAATTVSQATVSSNVNSRGILEQGTGAAVVQDSVLVGGNSGVEADLTGANVTIVRSRFSGASNPVLSTFGSAITVSDSLIELGSVTANALSVSDNGNPANFTGSITARRVTIVGDGVTSQRAASAFANSAADNYSITISDSVIANVITPLSCFESAGTATIATDYSSVPAGSSDGCGGGITQTHAVSTAAPRFVNAAAGDYRLRYDSPLVDAGDPAALAATTDLGKLPRPVDGNGDGSAIRDVGAYEYQRAHPSPAPGRRR